MKNALLAFCLLLSFITYSQNYEELWKKVAEFELDGKVKSAAEETDKIYALAKKDKNEPQIIKTFFYKSKYLLVLEEDAQNKIISNLKKERQSLSEPSKALLESIYAEILDNIYTNKRYEINSRAIVDGPIPQDINAWTSKNFQDEIKKAYQRSLKKKEILYNTPLEKYEAVVELNLTLIKTNRSLYDFLAERYINSPLYTYTSLDGETAKLLIMDTSDFLKFTVKDSTVTLEDKIILQQEMERDYLAKNDINSLHRSILRRLRFSYTNISYSQKDETYLNTLISLSDSWKSSLFIYNVKLMLAEKYYNLASKDSHRDYFIKALDICNEIIENSKNAGITQRALQLKNNIVNSKIAMSADSRPVSNEPILAKVNFKNVDSISLEIYKISRSQYTTTANDYNRSLEFINGKKPHITQQYTLPSNNDFFEYNTEIIVPALESGLYLAAIKPLGKNIDPKREYGFITLQASQITLVSQETDHIATYQVLDRISGMPVKGAKINIKGEYYRTDKNGNIHFTYPEKKDYMASITAIHKKDTLNTSLSHRYYSYHDNTDDDEFTATCQLYLDRAIYRPGQTVFFKGIAIQNKNGIKSVVPNIYINVTVDDADNDELKTFRLKTNEFGSFTGQFDIPKNALTGSFSITADEDVDSESDENYNTAEDEHPFWDYVDFNSEQFNFQVEEYKKPTFEIQFDPISTNIPLNEKISVKGTAKAFSSASISGAKVIYAISRRSGYTNHKFYGHEDSVISEGETLTDEEGRFSIDFITVPNPEFNRDGLPIFTYEINAAVTDITGEMHQEYFEVYAGYHSLKLRASIQPIVKPEGKNTITLSSTNLNGEFMAAEGEIKIYKLTTPEESFLRDRPWPSPEIQTIPEDLFKQNFPYYPYTDIKNKAPERETLVFSQKVNTTDAKSISLKDFSGWQSGEYELVFTALDSAINKETEVTRRFTFEKDDNIFKSEKFAYRIVNNDYLKDGYAKIEMHTAVKNLFVNIQAFYNNNIIYDKYIMLDDKIKTIKIPVDKNIQNEMPITFNYVWQNKHYDDNQRIKIEHKTEELQIISTSIKNKIQPGSNETWSFTINGNNREMYEVLASMYDTSLDQFTTRQWSALSVENYNWSNTIDKYAYLSSYNSFKIDNAPQNHNFKDFNDRLINFNLDINRITFTPAEKRKRSGKEILNSGGFIITGIVSDKTGPLPGASVNIYGTDRTAQTDIDGKFSIAVLKGEILEASFIDYETSSTLIENDNVLNIILHEGGKILEAVVIDRYRSVTTAKSAAAITTLSIETIEDRTNASVLQSLQGQVAGLNIGTASGQPGADSTIILRGVSSINDTPQPLFIIDGIPVDEDGFRSINQNEIASFSILKDAAATSIYGSRGANGVIIITTFDGLKKEKEELEKVQTRKNLNETAFFYPQLLTDKDGNLSFSFTSPEALTQWKLRLLAHDKNAVSGFFENIAITQKDLMITPNMPRFFREQDTIVIIAKINNMTHEAKAGSAMLQLYNASSMEAIDVLSLNSDNMKPFSLDAKGSTTVSWKIRVPEGVEGIQYKVLAKSGNFTDGEESIIPVLSNRMLVTESIPLWVRENTSKEYTIENLKNNTSSTLKSHKLVFEYTSNPAWIALQSLPYLMEYEYNCSEQIFSRFYANAIAAHIVNSNPKIAEVFNTWRKEGKPTSKLEQNEELKSLIASESPWMLDAKNEEENKNRMALLFELDKIRNSMANNLRQLNNRQSGGAFSWFEGGDGNEFITRHILSGLGHLQKMSIEMPDMGTVNGITKAGIAYIDKKFIEHDKQLKKNRSNTFKASFNDLHYLYTRSYYKAQYPVTDSLKTKIQPYLDYSKENWLSYSLYQKAMAALVLNRFGEEASAKKILVSLKETATNNPEWGMYWKENKPGYYWYNSPIETQALLIEAFIETDNDIQSADAMKVWLIKNKQNKSWPTTKSTTEAIYALLMKGSDWLSVKDSTTIKLGNEQELATKMMETEKEAGTGYMKLVWNGNDVKKELATVSIHNKSAVPGYGGFYWQYFEDIDKIKPAEQGLIKISKELFIKNNTNTGTEYKPVTNESNLKVGDVVMVRLTLEVKEDLEYVHLKDVRASAFEPVDVISSYERNGGLSYYKSTRDAATHFFFDKVNKGTYILEYEVKVNNAGSFSGGISTMQSMYAPEFSGNSGGGDRIKINQQ